MRCSTLGSAQTTASPLKMLNFPLEGIVRSGEFRIHNSKVVGSSPPPYQCFQYLRSAGGLHFSFVTLLSRKILIVVDNPDAKDGR